MNTILSILMLTALALVVGAVVLWRKKGLVKQASLMLVLAVVMIVNVLIWTVPDEGGVAPVDALRTTGAAK